MNGSVKPRACRGRPRGTAQPPYYTKRVVALVSPEMLADITAASAAAGISVGEFVRRALADKLET